MKENDEEPETEKPEDNRRHAGQIENRDPDESNKAAVATVFAQINGAADADEQCEEHRTDHEQRGPDDARPDATGGISDRRRLDLCGRMLCLPLAKLAIA